MIFKMIGRIFIVGFALCLSVSFGFFILSYLGGTMLSEDLVNRYGSDNGVSSFETTIINIAGLLSFIFTLYPALTILPALLVATIGEIGHIRSWLFYVIASGIGALSIPFIYVAMNGTISGEQASIPSQSFLAIFATSGFGAGLLYWLIAGRRA